MNCPKYQSLTVPEKTKFIGKLLHAAQSNDIIFDMCNDIIAVAEARGVMDGVVILPEVDDKNIKH